VVAIRSELIPPSGDRAIAALAARQHGVVARAQLRALGLSESAIARRAQAGRLHRVHTSVYTVGHPLLTTHGRWLAAVLACGPQAALSHASSGALWEIRRSDAVIVDVTVPRTGSRRRPGLRIHRPRVLRPDEVTTKDGIPVTTAARTLLDLAATLKERELHRALDQAEIRELTEYRALDAIARAHPGHRGAVNLARALTEHYAGTTLTRSELEERFLALCAAYGLPTPAVNAHVGTLEVDFLFPRERVVVETDGFRFHGHRAAFERDRRRDAELTRAGYRALRFTHRQIVSEPAAVAATVAAALAQHRAAA
jgi:predicted transcriptional regulator of viral defense system